MDLQPRELLSFVQLRAFVQGWERLGLDDDDLRALEEQIQAGPEGAPVVAGTGGLRKLRYSPPSWGKGKRGAARVGYFYFVSGGLVYLIIIYSKNRAGDISEKGKLEIRRLIAALQKPRRG